LYISKFTFLEIVQKHKIFWTGWEFDKKKKNWEN